MEEFDKLIVQAVRKSAAKCVRHGIAEGFLVSFLVLSGCLLVYVFLSNLIPAYSIVPGARRLLLLLCVVLPVLSILIPLLRKPTVARHALRLEELNSSIKNNLLAAIQLSRARKSKEAYSERLIDEVTMHTHELLGETDLKEPVNPFRFDFLLRSSAGMLILLLLFSIFIPSQFYFPLFTLMGKIPLPDRTVLKVIPGDVSVMRGSSMSILVVPYGRIPKEIEILYQEGSRGWTSESYSTGDDVRKDLPRVISEVHYKARAKGVSTKEYTIEVTYPPELTSISLKYVYPAYTQLPAMVSTKSNGNIVALAGTKIYLSGEASQELDAVQVVFEKDTVRGEVDGNRFSAALVIDEDQFYTIELVDVYGNENVDPQRFSITAIPDEYPSVRIVEPGIDIDVPKDMIVPIEFRVTDDFGISRVDLVYSLEGTSKRELIRKAAETSDSLFLYNWDLTEIGLLPGKSASYFVEVYDNDTYSGPKFAKSESYTVNFPTLHEIYERIAEEERRSIDEIASIMPAQEEIYKQLDEIATKLKATKNMAWEKRQMVEEVIEKQKQIVEEVEKLSKQMEEAVEQMQEGLVVDEEILSKMAEVARLMKEVMTEEIREALEELREAMESLRPEEIERALRELKLTQEELSESLERTLEILKRLKQERELKQLADEAAQLQRQEEELKQRTESSQNQEELEALAKEQERIREKLEELQKKLAELSKELPEISDCLQESANKSQETLAKMEKASGTLSCGMKNESLSLQNQILGDLSSLQENLSLACASLSSARKKEITDAMKRAIRDIVYLSKTQENLTEDIRDAMDRTAVDTRDLAVSESVLDRGVAKVADRVYRISQKTLFISPSTGKFLSTARTKIKEAEDLLEEGRASKARKKADQAMENLNQAAVSLMRSLSSCQSSSCASGTQECLQNMGSLASRQGALNEATQGVCPIDLPNVGLSMEARAQLARLAAEQRAIKEGVAGAAETFTEKAELAGRIDDLVKEMEDIARSIERRQLGRSIIERQERILSRLLDAQRSVRRRDYTRKRKAESGESVTQRESPESVSPELREKLIREDMLRALKEGYPPEYENLIKAYFKALSE